MLNDGYDNYDITMCNDGLCSKREHCHRYLAYQEYKEVDNDKKPMLISLKADSKRPFGGCSLFWEEK